MSAKPGRNDPCPCGSGKKFKRCCLVREEEAARDRAREQALFDDEIDLDEDELDEDWLDSDDQQYEIMDDDWPSLDVRTISRVRYTHGTIRKLADLHRDRGLHVTEWEAPDIPQAVLDSIERENLAALEGEWGNATVGNPIQVDQIDIDAGDDIFSIDVFNRAICLATTDDDEMRRIHSVCETLSAAAPDDHGRLIEPVAHDVEVAIDWESLAKQHRQQPGTCSLCEAVLTRRKSRTHFGSCAPAHDPSTGKERALVHLQATAPGLPAYWLDIEASMDATLETLDAHLRHEWVECCGHLSLFTIGDVNYYSHGSALETGPFQVLGLPRPAKRRMTARLIDVLPAVGNRFRYEYDFGSTTVLDLKVIARRSGRPGRTRVRVLARNTPPVWPCAVCGGPATMICRFCGGGGNPFVCNRHRRQHACGEREGLMLVVNSPRMGVCGYGG